MDESFRFYTEVLGGTPIITGNGFKGPEIHNALLQKEELEHSADVPNLRDGSDELDVRFVQLENVVLELLQYHPTRREGEPVRAFPTHPNSSSPAVTSSMHISFYLGDEVDVDQFVIDLENKAAEMGFDKVRCNRINSPGQGEVRKFEVQGDNDFDGWTLVYCKGPSGEQLEFNQVLRRAKKVFGDAYAAKKAAIEG